MQGTSGKVKGLPNPIPSTSQRRVSLDGVLGHAWENAVFTASDAMAAAGITRSTAIDVLEELVELGLLRELPNARVVGDYRKGRPARRFELRSDAAAIVGIDAGRGHLIATVADLRGSTIARTHLDLDPEDDAPEVRLALAEQALDDALAAAELTRSDVISLCIGVPAPVDAAGLSPPHRDGFWRRMNPGFAQDFARPIPLVRVENDAYLAAVAENATGAAVGCDDFIVLLAGERLGAGVAVDGRILRGAHGGVAEMVAFDRVTGVGGAWGLGYRAAQWAREAVASGEVDADHPLAKLRAAELDGRHVLELAASGDPDALRVAQRVGEMLAVITGIFGSLFDPRRVIVSGAVADGIGPVIEAARRALPDELDLPMPELHASSLGAEVVVLGAVAAAVQAARDGVLDLPRARRVGT